MNNWTTTAHRTLEGYLERNRLRVSSCGADADEVVADLRRHVEQEVAALRLPVVTHDDVQRIVRRIGPLPDDEPGEKPPPPQWNQPKKLPPLSTELVMVFGIVLPVITIAFELATHLCAGTFFDPLPTWMHVLLAAAVPAANWLAWREVRRPDRAVPDWLWLGNAVACGVSLFYTALYLPMMFFAIIGIFYFGLGLLPLAPVCALSSALWLRGELKRQHRRSGKPGLRGWGWAMAGSLALLLGLALPASLTRHWIDRSGSDSPEEANSAIANLRLWGSESILLMECYGRGDRLWIELFGGRRPNAELARKAYYRVTGKPFNSVAPPLSKYQRAGRDLFGEFDWDQGLGGETVAGQVRGLSLAQSRFDGMCRPDEGWAYFEWILEFRNDHERSQREARAQILLPPEGVVSRLTLWVNGEEREAAFAGRAQVREAYQKVAVQQRRDPVLVTTTGPDRVLVQCFPIPPNGGTMKIRLGITAPLLVENSNHAALKLPRVIERNFGVASPFRHSLWLEAPEPASVVLNGLTVDRSKPGKTGIHGEVADAVLGSVDVAMRFAISPRLQTVRALDKRSNDGAVIVQTLEQGSPVFLSRIAIVLDGSEDMNEFFPSVARALNGVPAKPELGVWLAQDGVRQIYSSEWRSSERVSEIVGKLRGVGGQDDVPALLQAWEWAAAKADGTLLWIHGPQPVVLSGLESLRQRLEWRAGRDGPLILDLATRSGPNRITEQLGTLDAFTAWPRLGDLHGDLERLFAIWSGRRQEYRLARAVDREAAAGKASATASSHIVRLWAAERVRALTKSRQVAEALKLAARYQLVTAISGAVVLETQQQYQAAGLTPVEAASVPTVPEPGTWILLMLGLAALAFKWRKRK